VAFTWRSGQAGLQDLLVREASKAANQRGQTHQVARDVCGERVFGSVGVEGEEDSPW